MRSRSDKGESFSREWAAHVAENNQRTWGYSAQERLEQLYLETDTTAEWFAGKVILDAGCGNGELSDQLGALGATVVGLDFSSSVRAARRGRRSTNVHFVQGDLQAPPLAPGLFDLVFAIGVLHHTRDTQATFRNVAPLVKAGGRFYVWLYRRPERFVGRFFKVPTYDAARAIISRCGPRVQTAIVSAYARLVRAAHAIRAPHDPIPLGEYVVAAFDDLTPRWRHYHTPTEVCRWFHECGFKAPLLTHWDNPYGFGLVATRNGGGATPGIHYGAEPKLWDSKRSRLGRLHQE